MGCAASSPVVTPGEEGNLSNYGKEMGTDERYEAEPQEVQDTEYAPESISNLGNDLTDTDPLTTEADHMHNDYDIEEGVRLTQAVSLATSASPAPVDAAISDATTASQLLAAESVCGTNNVSPTSWQGPINDADLVDGEDEESAEDTVSDAAEEMVNPEEVEVDEKKLVTTDRALSAGLRRGSMTPNASHTGNLLTECEEEPPQVKEEEEEEPSESSFVVESEHNASSCHDNDNASPLIDEEEDDGLFDMEDEEADEMQLEEPEMAEEGTHTQIRDISMCGSSNTHADDASFAEDGLACSSAPSTRPPSPNEDTAFGRVQSISMCRSQNDMDMLTKHSLACSMVSATSTMTAQQAEAGAIAFGASISMSPQSDMDDDAELSLMDGSLACSTVSASALTREQTPGFVEEVAEVVDPVDMDALEAAANVDEEAQQTHTDTIDKEESVPALTNEDEKTPTKDEQHERRQLSFVDKKTPELHNTSPSSILLPSIVLTPGRDASLNSTSSVLEPQPPTSARNSFANRITPRSSHAGLTFPAIDTNVHNTNNNSHDYSNTYARYEKKDSFVPLPPPRYDASPRLSYNRYSSTSGAANEKYTNTPTLPAVSAQSQNRRPADTKGRGYYPSRREEEFHMNEYVKPFQPNLGKPTRRSQQAPKKERMCPVLEPEKHSVFGPMGHHIVKKGKGGKNSGRAASNPNARSGSRAYRR